MTEPALLDNDIVLKLCCFNCHMSLSKGLHKRPHAILGIGRFTLRDRIKRSRSINNREKVALAIEEVLAGIILVEPNEEELELATRFEESATRLSVDFDVGESQLLAILIRRGNPFLLTGDKRAIAATRRLGIQGISARLVCLEQVLTSMITMHGFATLRTKVCKEATADRAAAMCFTCGSNQATEEVTRTALISYVRDLRGHCGDVLFDLDEFPLHT